MLQFNSLRDCCGISHFVTLRNCADKENPYDGFNVCDYSGDNEKHINDCRNSLCNVLNISTNNLVLPHQVHDNKIGIVLSPTHISDYDKLRDDCQGNIQNIINLNPEKIEASSSNDFDALICNRPEICIGVSTADCVPIILYAPKKNAIAVIHAGWRGTVKHIANKCAKALMEIFDVKADEIIACIGPSISPEKFETGAEVVQQFFLNGFTRIFKKAEYIKPDSPTISSINEGNNTQDVLNCIVSNNIDIVSKNNDNKFILNNLVSDNVEIANQDYDKQHLFNEDINETNIDFSSKYFIDLWAANKIDLINAGISEQNIEISGICTYSNYDKLFSARKIGVKSGRIATVIMLNNPSTL